MSKLHKMGKGVAVALLTTSMLSGCSYVIKTGANVALGFSENHIVQAAINKEVSYKIKFCSIFLLSKPFNK